MCDSSTTSRAAGAKAEKLVSIVLPIYNGEKYMRESIDSVLAQTYQNWELLIIDDGSTDRTAEIATDYAARDPRIFYQKNPHNIRLPKTLNRGFSLARGAYLTWTSDDNFYYPNALERMVNALDAQKKDFVFASCDVIDGNGNVVECIMVDESAKKRIVGSNPVGACFLYSRRAYQTVGEYDPDFALVEDFDYWQRICMKFDPVCISEKLYAYRWHDGALTSTMRKDTFYRILEKCLLKNRPGFGKLNWEAHYYYYHGLFSCRKNLSDSSNPYKYKYWFLSFLYFFRIRVPNKLRRILIGIISIQDMNGSVSN